ncbi:hypothetical protein U1Q18_039910 [Sarracenia purpurea var. burkii]
MVIHFTTGDRGNFRSSSSHSSGPGSVKSCTIDCFLKGGEIYIFRYAVSRALFLAQARGGTCTLAASDPPEDVLHRAEFLLNNGFGGYHLFENNCEDFAIYCKTGLLVPRGRSGQVLSFSAVISAAVPLSVGLIISNPGLLPLGCSMYFIFRLTTDIGVRRDATKVPVESLISCSGLDE